VRHTGSFQSYSCRPNQRIDEPTGVQRTEIEQYVGVVGALEGERLPEALHRMERVAEGWCATPQDGDQRW
jgi:hypothetical protein